MVIVLDFDEDYIRRRLSEIRAQKEQFTTAHIGDSQEALDATRKEYGTTYNVSDLLRIVDNREAHIRSMMQQFSRLYDTLLTINHPSLQWALKDLRARLKLEEYAGDPDLPDWN